MKGRACRTVSQCSTGPEQSNERARWLVGWFGPLAKILACGFVNLDMIAAGLPGLPEPGGVVHAPNGIRFWLGGHTANVSVDLVQLGAEEGSVAIAAAVGKDVAGRFIEDFLISKKVASYIQ